MTKHGIIELAGERWRLRFTRDLRHPPEKVWRAVTEPEHLAAWFPTSIEGDRAAGARLRFTFPKDEAPPMDGEMLAYDPPRAYELRWGEDLLRIELEPIETGTRLTLTDIFDEVGRGVRDAAGWHFCLDNLELHLAGDPPRDEGWQRLEGEYQARFPAEAGTIGPPEGADTR